MKSKTKTPSSRNILEDIVFQYFGGDNYLSRRCMLACKDVLRLTTKLTRADRYALHKDAHILQLHHQLRDQSKTIEELAKLSNALNEQLQDLRKTYMRSKWTESRPG